MKSTLEAVPKLKSALEQIMENEAAAAERRARGFREAIASLDHFPQAVMYEVHLDSLWASDGEKPVTERSKKGLEQAFRQAQTKFKKLNNRNDVQARYTVRILIGSERKPEKNFPVLIPQELYAQFI